MHRNYHFLLSECSPVRKTTMFENSDLYRMNWRKRYFDAFFMLSYPIHVHLKSRRTFLSQIIGDFPTV